MLSKHYRIFGALLATSALIACQQQSAESQADGAPIAAVPATESAKASTSSQVAPENISFTVSPDAIKQCPGAEPVAAEVTWLVRDMAVTEVKVEVANAGQNSRKLLSLAGRQGKATTEAWVVVGSRFFLTDNKTGQELASFEMLGSPCN